MPKRRSFFGNAAPRAIAVVFDNDDTQPCRRFGVKREHYIDGVIAEFFQKARFPVVVGSSRP